MDYLQGGLREMLSNVVTDLVKVSDGLLHENDVIEEACRRTGDFDTVVPCGPPRGARRYGL